MIPFHVTEENYAELFNALDKSPELAVDTETTGLNVRNKVDFLMGVCISDGDLSAYLPFRHKKDNLPRYVLDRLISLLSKKDLDWHNRKFDYHSFKTIGVDPLTAFTGKQWDSSIMAHMVNEEWYSRQLDQLGKRSGIGDKYKKDEVHKWGKIFGYINLPVEMIEQYGLQDAWLTFHVKKWLMPMMQEQELLGDVYDTEESFTNLLYKLEQRGVGVNKAFCEDKAQRGRGVMDTITDELGFNPASPRALGNYLLTELGMPVVMHTKSCGICQNRMRHGEAMNPADHPGPASFDKKAMEEYDMLLEHTNNPAAKLVQQYRGWQKAVTSLYEPMLEKVGPDGRVRTDFRQDGTVTRRLSSADPNLQQIPRATEREWNGNAKSAFTSGEEGLSLIGYDYSQLELRLGAAYGNERSLIEEFEKPDSDVFSMLAPQVFGLLTPETRHQIKNGLVYPVNYGAGLAKIAYTLGRTLDETREVYDRYNASIPGITAIRHQVTNLASQRGWIRYWEGSRRHFTFRADAYKAWNSLLQGGSSQLVKRSMLRCEEFESEDCEMRLQVHDEITFAMNPEKQFEYEPLIVNAMTNWPNFGVNLAVEGKEWK